MYRYKLSCCSDHNLLFLFCVHDPLLLYHYVVFLSLYCILNAQKHKAVSVSIAPRGLIHVFSVVRCWCSVTQLLGNAPIICKTITSVSWSPWKLPEEPELITPEQWRSLVSFIPFIILGDRPHITHHQPHFIVLVVLKHILAHCFSRGNSITVTVDSSYWSEGVRPSVWAHVWHTTNVFYFPEAQADEILHLFPICSQSLGGHFDHAYSWFPFGVKDGLRG